MCVYKTKKSVVCNVKHKEEIFIGNRNFILVDSPSSGEVFTKFKELHVIEN